MTATGLNTQHRSDVAVKAVSIRKNVPQGILDGIRLICKTSMDGCGWVFKKGFF